VLQTTICVVDADIAYSQERGYTCDLAGPMRDLTWTIGSSVCVSPSLTSTVLAAFGSSTMNRVTFFRPVGKD
jgi:hypothetical protein